MATSEEKYRQARTMENRAAAQKCEKCSSPNMHREYVSGQVVCENCGAIVEEDVFDYPNPLPAFNEEGERVPYHLTNPVKVGKGLGTIVGTFVKRLGYENPERSYIAARPSLRNAWRILNLPEHLAKESARLYRLCIEKHLTRGRNMDSLALATAYIVSVNAGMKVDIDWVSDMLTLKVKEVKTYAKTVRWKLGTATRTLSLSGYIRTCAESESLPNELIGEAFDLKKQVVERKLEQGRRSAVLAGAIVYSVCLKSGTNVSRKKIASALGVSEKSVGRVREWLDNILSTPSSGSIKHSEMLLESENEDTLKRGP